MMPGKIREKTFKRTQFHHQVKSLPLKDRNVSVQTTNLQILFDLHNKDSVKV